MAGGGPRRRDRSDRHPGGRGRGPSDRHRRRARPGRRRTARCWPSATGCRRSSTRWHARTPARSPTCRLPGLSRSDRLPGAAAARTSRPPRRTSTPRSPSRPARNWWCRSNARYALNAANARWGSLYDALYGTDAIPETGGAEKGSGYNPVRGAKVIAFARARARPGRAAGRRLAHGRDRLPVEDGQLVVDAAERQHRASRTRRSSSATRATRPRRRRAAASTTASTSRSRSTARTAIGKIDAGRHQGHRARSRADHDHGLRGFGRRGRCRRQGAVYRNWLGLMKGKLTEDVAKGGKTFTRRLNPDRKYTGADGADADAARPLADVRAQRRPPDDQSGDSRRATATRFPRASSTR